jgi:pyruvate/2-oxoglutarate dehydrogenase complex dihydrolipoamide acyltransferase (E2) component
MSQVEVKVPDIGDFKEVEVIELLVKPGDTVQAEQSLITVESDKASMEIPSSASGVVKELKVKLGDKVAEGSLVLLLEVSEAASAPAPASQGGLSVDAFAIVDLTDSYAYLPVGLARAQRGFIVGGGWTAASDPATGLPRVLRGSMEGNLWVARRVIPALDGCNVLRGWAAMNLQLS